MLHTDCGVLFLGTTFDYDFINFEIRGPRLASSLCFPIQSQTLDWWSFSHGPWWNREEAQNLVTGGRWWGRYQKGKGEMLCKLIWREYMRWLPPPWSQVSFLPLCAGSVLPNYLSLFSSSSSSHNEIIHLSSCRAQPLGFPNICSLWVVFETWLR